MPLRKCLGCNKIKESSEMIKITRVHNTQDIIINPDSTCFGRSAYVCYNKVCTLNVIKKKRVQKALKRDIPKEITEQLTNIVSNG